MKKILVIALVLTSISAFAANYYNESYTDYKDFQKFDNQISIGASSSQMTLANGGANQSLQVSQNMAFDAERLFNNGIWANLNAYIMTNTNSLGNQSTGTGMGYGMPATQDPFVGGFNAKVGYAYPPLNFADQAILLTPYILLGRNTNLAMSTILANGQVNVSNDFFYTGGLGLKAQYMINQYIDVYLDQSWAYNWDQSGPLYGIQPQNSQTFTTTLGAKFNVYQQLQLGTGLFYNNYQYAATAPATTTLTGGNVNGTTVSVYQPQYSFGGMVSIGMTF
ncbi:MAG: hypothetical protein LW807_05985 [Proteobacteria bacterium]|jgi:hypothetical protein|nr:hypothetical protein [Pseudomonadota bacterium]